MKDETNYEPVISNSNLSISSSGYSHPKSAFHPHVYVHIPYETFQPALIEEQEAEAEKLTTPAIFTQANDRLVIDMLRELKGLYLKHDERAATSKQLESQGQAIQEAIHTQTIHLKNTISDLQDHLEKLSVKRRMTAQSFFCVLISLILLGVILMYGSLVIKSPFPEFAVAISALFFLMARTLPETKR